MSNKPGGGKHKKYGPKLPNPRIRATKEHRLCGPLGYKRRADYATNLFCQFRKRYKVNPDFKAPEFVSRRKCLDDL